MWIAIAASAIALLAMSTFERAWLHPHFFVHNMPRLIPDALGFKWRDLLLPFSIFEGQEYRPRFLAYYVLIVEHHLRLWLYQYVLIPPTLSIAWPLEAYSVYLLYKVTEKLTDDRTAGLIAVAVYASSVGFLSGFGLNFMPGKPLTNVVLIGAMYLALHGRLAAMAWLVFFGCFLDETALIVPFAVFAMFPRKEVAWKLAGPLAGFLFFGIFLTPLITRYVFGYGFNFVETALHGGSDNLSLDMTARNVFALFGSTVVPYQLADPAYFIWPYAIGFAVLLAFTYQADRRVWAGAGVFLVMFSLLMSRHGGWAYGFYYGSTFAVFLALLIATAYRGRWPVLAFACFAVAMQINNFAAVQERWASVHDQITNKEYFEGKARPERPTRAELSAIYEAWRAGQLEPYLVAYPPSAGALYLVAELRQLSKIKH